MFTIVTVFTKYGYYSEHYGGFGFWVRIIHGII